MMSLKGSCHCGAVTFEVKSHTPQPYMRCYCSICRKTAGGGGFAINIMGEARTLKVKGRKHLGVYRATLEEGGVRMHSSARRHFCKHCGSALFIADPRWKKWVYPHASAIDAPLPVPVETAHIMLDSKSSWVQVPGGKRNRKFHEYPDQSIEDWHKARGVYVK
jgi:hypothetical protein